jgi:hypothetical protein
MADTKYNPDEIGSMIDEAPEAGFVQLNYGALTVKPQVLRWTGDKESGRKPERSDMPKGYKLATGETLELVFNVEIAEFNPQLQFAYERTVSVKKSSAREKTDWTEIVEASLKHVFGDKWVASVLGKRVYVEVEDAPNISGRASKSSGKVYGVPKFIRAFKSAAECKAARDAKFTDVAGGTAGEIPAAVVAQTKALLASLNGDEAQLLTVLASKPFGSYEPAALAAAAK